MKTITRLFRKRAYGSARRINLISSGMKYHTALLALILVLLSSGCMLGPKFTTPEVLTAEKWRELGEPQYSGQPADHVEWWLTFNDPVLNGLIEEAFAQNLSLQAAALRIVQARVARTTVAFTQLPLVLGEGSVAHINLSENVSPDVEIDHRSPRVSGPIADPIRDAIREGIRSSRPSVSVASDIDVYDAGFDAIWELDLWGKKRQRFRASSESMNAAYAAYDQLMVALAAEIARTYVGIRTIEQRMVAMTEVLVTMQQFTAMTEERFNNNEALITDVKLAQLLTGIVQTSIPQFDSADRQLRNSLCVLLGRAPQEIDELLGSDGTIPAIPAQTAVGAPADLLRRRPDVRMAEHMAAAECARIGMAKAAILPSFSIFGAIGVASSDSNNLFESASIKGSYGGLASITNLINYPIMIEKVRLQDAVFQEALLQYRETVLRANLEVENSMYAFLMTQNEENILEGNVKAAMDTASMTMEAYKQGKVIVSVPLVALTFLSSQQDQLWATRGEIATNYIAIYKSLGGGWETRLNKELVPDEIREEMKEQADWWSFTGKNDLKTMQVQNITQNTNND